MIADAEPRRRCRPRKSRRRKRLRRPPGTSPRSITLVLSPAVADPLAAAARARGETVHGLVRRLLDVLSGEPNLVAAVLDDAC